MGLAKGTKAVNDVFLCETCSLCLVSKHMLKGKRKVLCCVCHQMTFKRNHFANELFICHPCGSAEPNFIEIKAFAVVNLSKSAAECTWKWKMPAYLWSKSWSGGTTRAKASFLRVREAMAARSQQSPVMQYEWNNYKTHKRAIKMHKKRDWVRLDRPSCPWQMSVLSAEPTMNFGLLQISCGAGRAWKVTVERRHTRWVCAHSRNINLL